MTGELEARATELLDKWARCPINKGNSVPKNFKDFVKQKGGSEYFNAFNLREFASFVASKEQEAVAKAREEERKKFEASLDYAEKVIKQKSEAVRLEQKRVFSKLKDYLIKNNTMIELSDLKELERVVGGKE